MKKVFAIICFCAVTLGAWGQNSVMDRVKEIRKAYSQALENIKSGQEDANQNNSASVIVNENWPGSGPCKFQVDFYFTSKFDDEGVFRGRNLYFIRTKDLWATRSYTAEYLIDPESRDLMFCFIRSPKEDGSGYDELRYYFSEEGQLVRQISNGETTDNPKGDLYLFEVRHCDALKTMFVEMPPYLDRY